jgi:hypothetical protein
MNANQFLPSVFLFSFLDSIVVESSYSYVFSFLIRKTFIKG